MAADDPLALPAVPPPAAGDHRWRDRFLVALFIVAIALPGLSLVRTWPQLTTRFENRPAAPWPPLALSKDFASSFELAFADRFGGRDRMVRAHHGALLEVFGVSALNTVMPGRDGWYFWLGEDGRSLDRHYRAVVPVMQSAIERSAAEFTRRHEWLAARGVAYLVTIAPEKFTIYPEYLPGWVAASDAPSPYDRLADALARQGRVNFVDLRPALREARLRERVYFKTDSHWNYNGAIAAYGEIMREVERLLPGRILPRVAPAPRSVHVPQVDFYSGDLVQALGLPSRIREDDVAPLGKILADTSSRCAQRIDKGEYPGFEFFACDRPHLPHAVVLRDSMAISLIPLLSENFRRVVYVSSRRLDPALIERERPDIVIEELVERTLDVPGLQPMPEGRPAGGP